MRATEYTESYSENTSACVDTIFVARVNSQGAPATTVDNSSDLPVQVGPPLCETNRSHPQQLDEYQLLREVGRGATGIVYQAQDTILFRQVAIKCLHESSRQSEGDIENLRAEARVSELMDHPFIIRIQKIAECNSRHYAVMPYIEGGSLSSLITSQPLSNRVAAGLLVNLCDAVSHMHRKGAIHCDLKPANVLLDEDGLPHIIDFGVARCIDQLTHSKAANTISGTPCYMSPEQALGDATSLGPHTDVYGLGAILYSVLTCRSPQNAETLLNIQLQALTANPTVPRKLNPAIDEELETICLDCLQKKPSERISTADILAERLHEYLHRQVA